MILKKIFRTEKSTSSGSTNNNKKAPGLGSPNSLRYLDDPYCLCASGHSSPLRPTQSFLSEMRSEPLLRVNHPFLGIEKQFEQLHEQFRLQPLSSLSQFKYESSDALANRKPRHVDILDALFSSYRYQMPSRPMSPTSLYNEDIADRNLVKSPQHKPEHPHNTYSRIVSALYQEDVADRNITITKADIRPSSNGSSREVWDSEFLRDAARLGGQSPISPQAGDSHGSGMTSASRDKFRSFSRFSGDNYISTLVGKKQLGSRPRTAVPDLAVNQKTTQQGSSVPGASHRLEKRRPRSAGKGCDLPFRRLGDDGTKDDQKRSGMSSSDGSRPPTRRNVRDLSINTQFATMERPVIKVDHVAVRPPTPNQYLTVPNASIAEIVNSPLPAATPTSISPQPATTYNAEEIMNMFEQAYMSTRATNLHPTFETLQEAIIREINSHDAFRRVPVPGTGPPFTPPASEESFRLEPRPQDLGPSKLTKISPEKEGQLTRLIRKGSLVRRSGKMSAKTVSPAKIKSYDRTFKRASEFSGRKRRHTYAQPPSRYWVEGTQGNDQSSVGNAANFRDDLSATRNQKLLARSHRKRKSDPVILRSTYHLQAQKFVSIIGEAATNNSKAAAADEDDEIIQLPNGEIPPPSQIKTVDNNNVTYILNATEPLTPSELMSLPQRTSRKTGIIDILNDSGSRSVSPFKMSKKRIPVRRSSLNKDPTNPWSLIIGAASGHHKAVQ